MTSPIRFLIIGVQKGGTSSLFEYMRRHPQIHMPPEKDIAFFNRDREFQRGWEWYLNTVTRGAPPGAACGEASTYYMSGTPFGDLIANEQNGRPGSHHDRALESVVPGRIKHLLPEVKLVCVLRDPVARAYSHYRMMVLERAESRAFDDAIDQLIEPERLAEARVTPTRTNNYIVNGEYFRALSGYLQVFPREQLMVLMSDDLADRPAETMKTLFEFVGVDHDFVPDNLDMRYRKAAQKERVAGLNLYRWQDKLARVRPARSAWHALPDGIRGRIDRGFSVLSYRVSMWNAHRGVEGEDISPETRKALISHFRPDSEALAGALDVNPPWLARWTDA